MKKIKPIIILLAVVAFLCPVFVSAIAQYQEIKTSRGKVIIGLDREKAYKRFGAPTSKGDALWYYSAPEEFFVKFSETPSILMYPNSYQAETGIPIDFKVFLSLPDSGVRDITNEVQLVSDQTDCAKLQGPGVIIPSKVGEYSVLAMYKGAISNPLYLHTKASKEKKKKEKDKLLSIDVLPYRPSVPVKGSIDFFALGTFFNEELNEYSVKEITKAADWFSRQRPDPAWNKEESRRLDFSESGQAEVLSEYRGIKSFSQRVEVKDKVDFGGRRLKHVLVLPEVMVVLLDSNINMKVFGTYYDNSVTELTLEVRWKIANPDIIQSNKDGYFLCTSEGVTEVTAIKDGVESLPIKIVVVNKNPRFLNISSMVNSEQENDPDQNTLEQIRDNVEKLKKDFALKKKELQSIKIMPESLEIGLGEEGKFSATGLYSDGSSRDLTILGNWGILNKSIAAVSGGKVACVSEGETSAYVEFKGVRSEFARVIVGGARLVSLLLTPQNLKIPRDGKASFKVQGNYYDQSQRDLTGQVSWAIDGPAVVKIKNGVVWPLKFGQSKIYAEYSGLKSNAASIDVILTFGWLLWLLAKITFFLLLGVLFLFFILYLLAENKRKQLRLLKDQPREFIMGLHENAIQLITIFGLRYDAYTFPLFYAELARQKFLVKDNVFLNFSIRFEEAKYSRHVLQDGDVAAAVNDYNTFFDNLCKNQSPMLSFYRYCLALAHCRPIFIISAPDISAAK
jgi:hypothetical protein